MQPNTPPDSLGMRLDALRLKAAKTHGIGNEDSYGRGMTDGIADCIDIVASYVAEHGDNASLGANVRSLVESRRDGCAFTIYPLSLDGRRHFVAELSDSAFTKSTYSDETVDATVEGIVDGVSVLARTGDNPDA